MAQDSLHAWMESKHAFLHCHLLFLHGLGSASSRLLLPGFGRAACSSCSSCVSATSVLTHQWCQNVLLSSLACELSWARPAPGSLSSLCVELPSSVCACGMISSDPCPEAQMYPCRAELWSGQGCSPFLFPLASLCALHWLSRGGWIVKTHCRAVHLTSKPPETLTWNKSILLSSCSCCSKGKNSEYLCWSWALVMKRHLSTCSW